MAAMLRRQSLFRWWAAAVAAVLGLLGLLGAQLALAAPAPWYYWRSTIDNARVCAQTSPGSGWVQDSGPFDGPGCQPRPRVFILPSR